jgi:SHS family lactate transporter-like MFS transporter
MLDGYDATILTFVLIEIQQEFSGFVQGAFSWGFMLAAAVFQFAYPAVRGASWGWRALLWSGLLPALLVFWLRRGVPQNPVWLASAGSRRPEPGAWRTASVAFPVGPTLLLGAIMFAYQSVSFWYGTLVRLEGRSALPHTVALNLGGILEAMVWGLVAGTRVGPTRTIALAAAVGLMGVPVFLMSSGAAGLLVAGAAVGISIRGAIGVAPIYVAAAFAPERRGRSGGVAYHAAAAIGAAAPLLLGVLLDARWGLREGMALCAGTALVAAITLALRDRPTGPS